MPTKPPLSRAEEARLGLEAAEWIVRLNEAGLDPEEPYSSMAERDRAFLEWTTRSPDHLRLFVETFEVHCRLQDIDRGRLIQIQDLLRTQHADVIPLFKSSEHGQRRRVISARGTAAKPQSLRRRLVLGSVAAASVLAVVTLSSIRFFASPPCVTNVGEQLTCKLEDGSFAILNTDSRIDVHFSAGRRAINLVRGEALFIVQHDTHRPFIVSTPTARVRAVGTQFNVRRREDSTDVAVIEGVVQVAAADISADSKAAGTDGASGSAAIESEGAMKLAAGEQAEVKRGRVAREKSLPATDVLAWRQRRLVFFDATLTEVAAEFNRYNRVQVDVEDSAAQNKRISGIFDADRPQALIIWAARDDSLVVQPKGDNWVIRAR